MVAARAAEDCTAPFTWDASTLNDRTVQPRRLASEMTVTVEVDESSARRVEPPEGASSECASTLEVDATVRLRTADGTFDEAGKSTLVYGKASALRAFGFDVAVGEQGGSLNIALGKNEQGVLTYALDGAGTSCAGTIAFSVCEASPGSNEGSGGGTNAIGQWSNTGCPLGQERIDLTTPRGNEPSLAEQLRALWADASCEGTWDDGKKTSVRVQLEVSATYACGTEGDLEIPVEVTWGTADGRIVEHATDAQVHMGFDVRLGLWISDEMKCKDTHDTLEYTRASCAEVQDVTLQLGLNSYGPGNVEVAGGGVNVYATPRAGHELPNLGMLTLTGP